MHAYVLITSCNLLKFCDYLDGEQNGGCWQLRKESRKENVHGEMMFCNNTVILYHVWVEGLGKGYMGLYSF